MFGVKTKRGVTKSRINERELNLKKVEKVMDCRIKRRERRLHYPVPGDINVSKRSEKTWGV